MFWQSGTPQRHLFVPTTSYHPPPLQRLHLPPRKRNHVHRRLVLARYLHRRSAPFEDEEVLDEESEKEWVGRILKHQRMAVRLLMFDAWIFEAVLS